MSRHLLIMSFPKTICFVIGMIGCVIAGIEIDMNNVKNARPAVFAKEVNFDIVPLVCVKSRDGKLRVIIAKSIAPKIKHGMKVYGKLKNNGDVTRMVVVKEIEVPLKDVAIFEVEEKVEGEFLQPAVFFLSSTSPETIIKISEIHGTVVPLSAVYYKWTAGFATLQKVELGGIEDREENGYFTFTTPSDIPTGAAVFVDSEESFVGITTSSNEFVAFGKAFLDEASIDGAP